MIKDIFLLGSTGSIGEITLNIIRKDKKNFKVKLLTTNKSIKKIYKQALEFKVNKIIIYDKKSFYKYKNIFEKKNIKVFLNTKDAFKSNKKKSYLTINGISGIEGLSPTLEIIKFTRNLALANKESIICGWKLIKNKLKKNKTNFIPLDSEHFSIWSLLKGEKNKTIKKIYLTASGGPFLKKNLNQIKSIKPKFALKHPNWKMGKKITIDSATMMNKIFEFIEAVKIFNLDPKKLDIIIHPKSYIHAVVDFNKGITKLLSHDTTMEIPIANSLYLAEENFRYKNNNFNYKKLNGLNFIKPDIKNFPLLQILKYKFKGTYLEIIIVSINDWLVKKYLENKISYISIHKLMLIFLKKPYFKKYYQIEPKNIKDIKIMVEKTNQYLENFLKSYVN